MLLLELKNKLNKTISSNETACFFCRCEIKYSGRAEAELVEGDRVIIVKSDNTVLIHQPEGSNPINYMKSDTNISLDAFDDVLVIKTYNPKNKDYLDIFVKKVYYFNSMKLEDGKSLVLVGTEKDMSDMIKENPVLISKDFKPLSREEHTKFGFIDVFGHDSNGNFVIIECKRYTAGLSAVQQLRRYVEKVIELKGLNNDNVLGVLAAPSITDNALSMLEKWGFSFKKVQPPKRLEKYNKNQKNLADF